jgi:hypothetical protein
METVEIPREGDISGNVQREHRMAEKRSLVRKLIAITDPDEKEKLKHSYSNTRLSNFEKLEIEQLRERLGHRTSTETIRWLLKKNKEAETAPIPPLTLELLAEPKGTPLVLCGRPGAGKSFTLKALLPLVDRIILFDLADEHAEIQKKMSLEALLSYKWSRNGQLKFCPSHSHELGTLEVRTLVEFFNRTKYDGRYRDWTVCIEEAHRLYKQPSAISLVLEGRKYFKRILVVSADPNLFPACLPVRPPPLDELLGKKT